MEPDGQWYDFDALMVGEDGPAHCRECVLPQRICLWGVTKTRVKDRGAFIHDKRTPVTHLGGLAHNPHIEVWKVGYFNILFRIVVD